MNTSAKATGDGEDGRRREDSMARALGNQAVIKSPADGKQRRRKKVERKQIKLNRCRRITHSVIENEIKKKEKRELI